MNRIHLLTMCFAAGLTACSGPDKVDDARPYPAKPQRTCVDVQVAREQTSIRLTNTSARAFPESTMWLNAQYAATVPAIGVGDSVTLDLARFRNEFSEPFRAGGFFATERPDAIVLAQIELEDEMFGLVVVQGKTE